MREAGCSILGGHSVADDEIKFGYAVTGTVHPERVKANAGARAGDALVFTKRIGTGVIATALKRGIAARCRCGGSDRVDAHAEPARLRGDAALRRPRLHRRHRLRAARPRARDGGGQRRHARDRRRSASSFCPARWSTRAQGAIPGGLKNNREFVVLRRRERRRTAAAKSKTCCTTRRPPAAC